MCQKANELIRKQQRKTCLKLVWNNRNIYDKLHFDDILLLEAMLTNRLHRKSTSKKKIQIKAWYRILGPEILSYEEFRGKQIIPSKMKII